MQGGTFGAAVDAKDNAWLASYGGKSIAVFDKNGKPLTPPEGITFNGQLGLMQGIIVTPSGDVWALGISKRQLLHFPKGDWTKGRIVCEGDSAEPCKSFLGPFHLAIDQQDRIWVSNASDLVFVGPRAPCKVLVKARGEAVRRGSLRRFTVSINATSHLYNKDHRLDDKKRLESTYLAQIAIYRLISRDSYGPDEIKAMTAAYETALVQISLVDRDGPLTELIANSILTITATGERDSEKNKGTSVACIGHTPWRCCLNALKLAVFRSPSACDPMRRGSPQGIAALQYSLTRRLAPGEADCVAAVKRVVYRFPPRQEVSNPKGNFFGSIFSFSFPVSSRFTSSPARL